MPNNKKKHQEVKKILSKIIVKPCNQNANVVEGTLEVDYKEDIRIHGVLLTIHGNVWTEITPCSNSQHKYLSNIFVQSTYIVGNGSATTVLTRGKHCFPFSFILPKHLPSSFDGVYGAINYMVTAQMKSANSINDTANRISQGLCVRRFLDLSDGSAYNSPISFPASMERPQKTLRTTIVPDNHLKFIFKVQKTGYATGELIPFVLDVYNPECIKIASMSVILVKKTVYGDLKYNKDVYDELADVHTINLDKKPILTWIGSLHVPPTAIPTHSVVASVPKKKPIFSHRYLLRVKLVPSRGNCVVGEMQIIIGTSKYECRPRRTFEHCSRSFGRSVMSATNDEDTLGFRRQSSVPPSYSQAQFSSERRASLETLPPPYEEAIAMASRTLAKKTKHLMG